MAINETIPDDPWAGAPNSGPSPYLDRGTPPPWMSGSSPGPMAPGVKWQDLGPQTDPQGNVWNWDGGQWVQQPGKIDNGPVTNSTPNPYDGGQAPTPFQWPTYTPPPFTPAQAFAPTGGQYTPTKFSYADFVLPSLADAQNQPGYKFGLQQGQDALQNSAAARGTIRSGGNLKDLFNWTNNAAEQNYGNVVNQDLGVYNTNRSNAFNNWDANERNSAAAYGVNLGTQKDVYNSGIAANQSNFANASTNAQNVFNPQFDIAKLSFADLYNRWKTQVDAATNIAGFGAS